MLQDNTDNNVQDLKSQVAAAQQKAAQQGPGAPSTTDPALANATPAQQAAAAAYGPNGPAASRAFPASPAHSKAHTRSSNFRRRNRKQQQLAAKDRELAYDSRFASNLVYTRAPDPSPQQPSSAALADRAGATGPQQSAVRIDRARIRPPAVLIAPRTARRSAGHFVLPAAQPRHSAGRRSTSTAATGSLM